MASSPSCCYGSSVLNKIPSILTPTKLVSPFALSTKPKPIKLNLSSSFSLTISHPPKRHRFASLLSQSSEWDAADDTTVTLAQDQQQELPTWENQGPAGSAQEDAHTEAVPGTEAEAEAEEEEKGEGDSFYEEAPSEDAKLFVGNLPYDVDSHKLASLFQQSGIVEIAEVIYNKDTDQSRGFGFVTMSTVEEAEKAVEMFNRYDLDGRLLTVNKAAPRGQRPERPPKVFEQSFRIYVGNLPWGVDDARLEQLFSEHGKVISARVVYDRETGRSRGFGFVTMASESEMNDSIAALDGQTLDGRALRVNVAEERPKRTF